MKKVNWTAILALSIIGLLVVIIGGSLLLYRWGTGQGWMTGG